MSRITAIALLFIVLALPGRCMALPDVYAARVVDVTASSFCVVWLTDTPSEPGLEIYSDADMTDDISSMFEVVPFPGAASSVAVEARSKGVMMAMAKGLDPGTPYYVRAVTVDSSDPASRSYSPLLSVTTNTEAASYIHADGQTAMIANDLVSFPVYVVPGQDGAQGLGGVILLEVPGSTYPLSSFVGSGVIAPEGVIDLNNLFGLDGTNMALEGVERAHLTIYRGGAYTNIEHYRWLDENSGSSEVKDTVRGFFADFNLDGKVDVEDFLKFKGQYLSGRTSGEYNPDYDFVDDPEGVVDVREFSGFAEQYGRDDVPGY